MDPKIQAMVFKKKKNVKPGYKKKIQWAIDKDRKAKRRLENRQTSRTARKSKKNSNQ